MEVKDLITAILRFTAESSTFHRCSSYTLKAIFEGILGVYISEEEFIKAMRETSYKSKKIGCSTFYQLRVTPNPRINKYYWGKGFESKFIQHG